MTGQLWLGLHQVPSKAGVRESVTKPEETNIWMLEHFSVGSLSPGWLVFIDSDRFKIGNFLHNNISKNCPDEANYQRQIHVALSSQ